MKSGQQTVHMQRLMQHLMQHLMQRLMQHLMQRLRNLPCTFPSASRKREHDGGTSEAPSITSTQRVLAAGRSQQVIRPAGTRSIGCSSEPTDKPFLGLGERPLLLAVMEPRMLRAFIASV